MRAGLSRRDHGLLLGFAASVATTGIGLAFVASGNHKLLLSTATTARYITGATLGAALLAAAGAAVGTVIRSQVGAIITVFIWGFVAEPAELEAVDCLLDDPVLRRMSRSLLKFGDGPCLVQAASSSWGGCHPDRDTATAIRDAGFAIERRRESS
jgi:hypothetical protein